MAIRLQRNNSCFFFPFQIYQIQIYLCKDFLDVLKKLKLEKTQNGHQPKALTQSWAPTQAIFIRNLIKIVLEWQISCLTPTCVAVIRAFGFMPGLQLMVHPLQFLNFKSSFSSQRSYIGSSAPSLNSRFFLVVYVLLFREIKIIKTSNRFRYPIN